MPQTHALHVTSGLGQKVQLSTLITQVGRDCLLTLQEHYGTSQAAVIEMLLRDKARELGYDLTKLKKLGRNK